jgi:hypothetical protein
LTDLQRIRDFWHGQPLMTQHYGSPWPSFSRPFLSPSIHPAFFGNGDSCRLPFLAIFRLDFRQPEKDIRNHTA